MFFLFVVILCASVPLWHVLLSRQGLVTHCSGLGGKTGKTGERFLFILRENDVACQAKHFEQLHCLVFYVGEDNQRAAFFRDVNYAEEDGNADTVHQLSVAEIYNQRSAAQIKLLLALALNTLTGEFVQIVARINDCGRPDAMRAYVRPD